MPFRKRRLAQELRQLRRQAGLTQTEVAHALRYAESTISRIENGQPPAFHALKSMLDLYSVTVNDWEPVLELWERATEKGWWHEYGQDDQGYISMENDAQVVREFAPSLVPDLLQIPEYTRTLYTTTNAPRSAQWVENEVAVRLRRQGRLTAQPPLEFRAIVAEAVLHQGIHAAVLRPQLRRILEQAQLPTVAIRILPRSAGLHDGLYGRFTVLGFPERDDPDMAYVEHAFGPVLLDEPSQVQNAQLRFDHLWSLAIELHRSDWALARMAS